MGLWQRRSFSVWDTNESSVFIFLRTTGIVGRSRHVFRLFRPIKLSIILCVSKGYKPFSGWPLHAFTLPSESQWWYSLTATEKTYFFIFAAIEPIWFSPCIPPYLMSKPRLDVYYFWSDYLSCEQVPALLQSRNMEHVNGTLRRQKINLMGSFSIKNQLIHQSKREEQNLFVFVGIPSQREGTLKKLAYAACCSGHMIIFSKRWKISLLCVHCATTWSFKAATGSHK